MPQPMRGMARVAFRALQPTIEAELKEGWTAKAIYNRHSDKLTTISYPQFARYCRLLKQPATDAKTQPHQPTGGPTNEPTKTSTTQEGPNSARRLADIHTGIVDPETLRKLTRG
jgi:hypothetical protein